MLSRVAMLVLVALFILKTTPSLHAQVNKLFDVPTGLPRSARDNLNEEHNALEARLAVLQSLARDFNSACAAVKAKSAEDVECQRRQHKLEGSRHTYNRDVEAFNRKIVGFQPLAEKAAELVAALNEISKWPIFLNQRENQTESPLPKGRSVINEKLIDDNCQTFFRALGKELAERGIRSWHQDFPLDHIGEPMADGIVAEIDKKAKEGHEWRKLDNWQDAQKLTNRGEIVVGGIRAANKNQHGHIAIVFPTPPGMDWKQFETDGHGPFVRDGNEHIYESKFEPSTWGAIRASRAMPLSQTSWYVWSP